MEDFALSMDMLVTIIACYGTLVTVDGSSQTVWGCRTMGRIGRCFGVLLGSVENVDAGSKHPDRVFYMHKAGTV